jgi:hypothetical protein
LLFEPSSSYVSFYVLWLDYLVMQIYIHSTYV